jgi:hypothetical protein
MKDIFGKPMHNDYILYPIDIKVVEKLKREFIDNLIANNIKYSACLYISSILNKIIKEWK